MEGLERISALSTLAVDQCQCLRTDRFAVRRGLDARIEGLTLFAPLKEDLLDVDSKARVELLSSLGIGIESRLVSLQRPGGRAALLGDLICLSAGKSASDDHLLDSGGRGLPMSYERKTAEKHKKTLTHLDAPAHDVGHGRRLEACEARWRTSARWKGYPSD